MKQDTRKGSRQRKVVTGEYSGVEYVIYVAGEEVYRAGNAHGDSQGYVAESDGVGIAVMRQYCESTAREIAVEQHILFAGVRIMDTAS